MIELIDAQAQEAVIKVIGVGGCGGNAVDHMIVQGVQGVEFICANTDAQALSRSPAHKTIQLGQSGLGAGSRWVSSHGSADILPEAVPEDSLLPTERDLLDHPGKVTAEIAKAFAESEFEKYRVVQDRLFESDFDRMINKATQKYSAASRNDQPTNAKQAEIGNKAFGDANKMAASATDA